MKIVAKRKTLIDSWENGSMEINCFVYGGCDLLTNLMMISSLFKWSFVARCEETFSCPVQICSNLNFHPLVQSVEYNTCDLTNDMKIVAKRKTLIDSWENGIIRTKQS
jgi:hypothetical protein